MTSHNTITIALRAHARPSSTSKLLPQLIINHRFCLHRNDFSERVCRHPTRQCGIGAASCLSRRRKLAS